MSKVYVVKHEREIDNVEEVVCVTTDKSKAEEIVETFIAVDTEFVGDNIETVVKDLCWIEEYPVTAIDDFDTQIQCEEYYRTP